MNSNPTPERDQSISPDAQTPTLRARRQYSETFKAELLQACDQPGATVSAVARKHALRPNQLRRWRQKAKGNPPTKKVAPPHAPVQTSFVALAVGGQSMSAPDIRMNLQSGATRIQIEWPVSASSQCAQWLREVLA